MYGSNPRVQFQQRTEKLVEFDIFPYSKGIKDTVKLNY